jgi:hypothetical protein
MGLFLQMKTERLQSNDECMNHIVLTDVGKMKTSEEVELVQYLHVFFES